MIFMLVLIIASFFLLHLSQTCWSGYKKCLHLTLAVRKPHYQTESYHLVSTLTVATASHWPLKQAAVGHGTTKLVFLTGFILCDRVQSNHSQPAALHIQSSPLVHIRKNGSFALGDLLSGHKDAKVEHVTWIVCKNVVSSQDMFFLFFFFLDLNIAFCLFSSWR